MTTAKRWFVIHTQTGREERVKASLESRRQIYNMQEQIVQVLVPTEKVSEGPSPYRGYLQPTPTAPCVTASERKGRPHN